MGLFQWWQHLPPPYRIFATAFGAIDGIILAAVAASQRSWLHLAGAAVLAAIFLMSFYPFFAPVQTSELRPSAPRSAAIARIAVGSAILFAGGWALVGAVLETIGGISSAYFAEGIFFVTGLIAMGGLFLWSGKKKLRDTTKAATS